MDFQLDPAFLATSHAVGDLGLSHVRLHGDVRYAWLVLIPRIAGLRELEDLTEDARARLMSDIVLAGAAVRAVGQALAVPVEKLNVGQLGNLTPQLHVHVVGRWSGDPAWPNPVWGHSVAQVYSSETLLDAVMAARRALGL